MEVLSFFFASAHGFSQRFHTKRRKAAAQQMISHLLYNGLSFAD